MNIVQNKAFVGAVAAMVGYSLQLLRAAGLAIPPGVDAPLYMLLVGALSLYLGYHGWKDALNTPAPLPASYSGAIGTLDPATIACLQNSPSPDGDIHPRPCAGENGSATVAAPAPEAGVPAPAEPQVTVTEASHA